ncbi:MAG: hypothetical protein HZA50_18115 [Planctomycetes bacterium]|nr:hypothetical protein [Planctomycetota bacterium]
MEQFYSKLEEDAKKWYESLDPQTRTTVDEKVAILKKFNAYAPLAWVESEMNENIPQVARFLFLHCVRSEVINGYSNFKIPDNDDFEKSIPPYKRLEVGEEALNRLIAAGVNREDIVRVARAAVCTAAFNFVAMLDRCSGPPDVDKVANAPDWALMEIVKKDGERKLSGRMLDGLHESIYNLYPDDE